MAASTINLQLVKTTVAAAMLLAATAAWSQTPSIPAPSRTVFKCTVNGKVAYSDDPCIGATRLDVQPTEGMNQISGKALSGHDVQRERMNRQVAESAKPLTGLTPDQFEVRRRRVYATPEVKRECEQLDSSIAQAEKKEHSAQAPDKTALQRDLFAARKRYRDLKC